MRFAAISLVILVAAAAATSTSERSSARAGKAPSCSLASGSARAVAKVSVEGQRRTALIRIPSGPSRRRPLVLALHGAGGNGRFMERYTGLTQAANSRGFVVAYPDAEGKFWQLAPTGEQAHDDVAFMRSLVDQLVGAGCVDPARVYATGVSNGGGLTARLGCEMSDRLAAIAPVAGGYAKLPPCAPDRPVSVLEVHGTDDEAVDYSQVAPFLAQWARLDSCSPPVARRRLTLRTLLVSRPRCAQGTQVQHVKLMGGPHAWPGTPIRRLPGSGSRFSATQAVMDFFATRRRSAPSSQQP